MLLLAALTAISPALPQDVLRPDRLNNKAVDERGTAHVTIRMSLESESEE